MFLAYTNIDIAGSCLIVSLPILVLEMAGVVWWLVNVAVSEVMNIHKRRAPFVIGGKFKLYLCLRCSRKHDITDNTEVIIFA